MTRKGITQADSAAAIAMLDAERAEPTHDPEVQYPPEIEQARILLVAAGWRVRPPAKTRQPRPERVYADPAVISAWLTGGVERLGSQTAVAKAIGLKVIGPVAAAVRGRPLSLAHFDVLQARLAEYVSTAPPAPVKAVKAAKPAAKKARAKVAGKGKRPVKNGRGRAPQPE